MMIATSKDRLEFHPGPLATVLDIKGLRNEIRVFKVNVATNILMRFHQDLPIGSGKTYSRFIPSPEDRSGKATTGIRNIGIFSTALCLETIAAYAKDVDECRRTIDGKEWVWDLGRNWRESIADRRSPSCLVASRTDKRGTTAPPRRKLNRTDYGIEKANSYFEFTIEGLSGRLGLELSFLTKVATLLRFGNYLSNWDIKEHFIERMDPQLNRDFYRICADCLADFDERVLTKAEEIHPLELFKFLQFVRTWESELHYLLWNPEVYLDAQDNQLQKVNALSRRYREADLQAEQHPHIFEYYFPEVYLLAKYELYRQISLCESGDSRLYDAKRLAYSLLIASFDNRFSNALIRDKALGLIFQPYRNDPNAVWPTGQQVAMSTDGLMIVSDNECACDLVSCEALAEPLLGYLPEIKCIYDAYTRTKRVSNGEIIGWYPIHNRSQTPTSWSSAFTLSFIKRFCELLSLELSRRAKERFRSNYRKANVAWGNIYDSTAVKAKLRLMFPADASLKTQVRSNHLDIVQNCRYRTAVLFGPPGTGKTTYARALATKLNLAYLELTPGDFFAAGEDSILVTINDIFEHLLHLKNTVVFIDEIDDLVKDRNPSAESSSAQPYDPRILFVNSLLPRFQELHDKGNIILLMATNNIDRVDEAIIRMGRVDLVIPVGAISPHGRLKFLQAFYRHHEDVLASLYSLSHDQQVKLAMKYLDATVASSYSVLKYFCEMVVEEFENAGNEVLGLTPLELLMNLFDNEAVKRKASNALCLWENKVVKQGQNSDQSKHDDSDQNKHDDSDQNKHEQNKLETRPRHTHGDFDDFSHFSFLGYYDTKQQFQEDFVQLYADLNLGAIDRIKAERIENTIIKYCNDFEMRGPEAKPRNSDGPYYNIMTPFFDDIEAAIANAEDDSVIAHLKRSLEKLKRLISRRTMLPA